MGGGAVLIENGTLQVLCLSMALPRLPRQEGAGWRAFFPDLLRDPRPPDGHRAVVPRRFTTDSHLGDNVAALQEAINMRGKGPQEALAQALAVLRGARSLQLAVGHLPSESNTLADCLSRLFAPSTDANQWPFRRAPP